MSTYGPPSAPAMDFSANAPESLPNVLTLADRCDGSQSEAATTLFVRPNGQTLQFCDHHAREYSSKVELLGFVQL